MTYVAPCVIIIIVLSCPMLIKPDYYRAPLLVPCHVVPICVPLVIL